jgi:hypothetical protein
MLRRVFVLLSVVLVLAAAGFAQQKTVMRSAKAKEILLGRHKISLQWISWDYFGTANVTERKGIFYLKGRQDGRKSTDFVSVDGVITSIDDKEFAFTGKIVSQISHIFGGKPCTRDGEMTFRITGKRKYWRMQEIDNPCDEAADYVDIYFR